MNAGLHRRKWGFLRHCLALVFRKRATQQEDPRNKVTRRGRSPKELASLLCGAAACRVWSPGSRTPLETCKVQPQVYVDQESGLPKEL